MFHVIDYKQFNENITFLKEHLPSEFWNILLIQGRRLQKRSDHPWSKGYYDYFKKKSGKITFETAKMAMDVLTLMEFKNYWLNENIKSYFLSKVKNPSQSYSILFELKIAFHFKKILNCNVQLLTIPKGNDRTCDIIVEKNGIKLEIECARRQYKRDRTMFNLASYLRKKAPQLSKNNPGIIVIHVPEYHNWDEIKQNRELERSVQNEFKKPKFNHITMVVFSCDHEPIIGELNGTPHYEMKIKNHKIRNLSSNFIMPNWFK